MISTEDSKPVFEDITLNDVSVNDEELKNNVSRDLYKALVVLRTLIDTIMNEHISYRIAVDTLVMGDVTLTLSNDIAYVYHKYSIEELKMFRGETKTLIVNSVMGLLRNLTVYSYVKPEAFHELQ